MSAQARSIQNTNRWDTRQLTAMSLLCAIGVLLSFIEFPACGILGAIIHGVIMADYWGALMNILVVAGYVLPAALVYRKMHTMKGAVLGLAAGIVCSIAMAIAGNIAITPIYLSTPVEAVVGMIVPILVPFNIVKALINSALTLIVYKSISNLITPKKKQVRGR